MTNIKCLTREERRQAFALMGQPAFREKQLFKWQCRGARSFSEMTDFSAALRAELSSRFNFDGLSVDVVKTAKDGTRKYLLGLADGNKIEAVFMKYEYGNSLCVSTQVGCSMGCTFCASTIGGRIRNLSAWEILDEFITVRNHTGEDINHIVLMGMGEPLDNYEEVSEFLRLIHDPEGINMGYRNITLSTCGIIPGIRRMGDEFPSVNMAISLHAATQAEREALMPIAKAYKLPELLDACREHCRRTGRRVTFEYALIAGKNDGPKQASDIVTLLSGMLCHVNLIPLNPVTETGLKGSSRREAEAFKERLEHAGIPATVRRELGSDIDAACGQLRKRMAEENKNQ